MAARIKADWIAIEGEFRAGTRSLPDIASDHGITEGAIRKHAKVKGWLRDPAGTKRERVKALLAAPLNTPEGTKYAERTLDAEAKEDERDMRLGLQAARLGLQAAGLGLKGMRESNTLDAKIAKCWSECIAINVNTIRKIRGLDDTTATASITINNPRSFD